MYFPMYDDDGNEIVDLERRERYMLWEQAERIRAFLDDVSKKVGVESEGVGDFRSVVECLKQIREENLDDLAPEAERQLNRAAVIDLDIRRHIWYIRKRELPINTDDYLT